MEIPWPELRQPRYIVYLFDDISTAYGIFNAEMWVSFANV